jgi:DNA-binding YbaB/EbfC family protein
MNINPFDILKNAQKIQEQMGSFQEKLGTIKVTGAAGGGMTEITLNGRMEVLSVRISPELMGGNDPEMLQDLVAAALTNAMEKVKETLQQEMGAMTGGMGGIPGMPGFPGGFPGVS